MTILHVNDHSLSNNRLSNRKHNQSFVRKETPSVCVVDVFFT